MKQRFISKYDQEWDNSNNITGELGIFVKKEYRRSNIDVSIIADSVIKGVMGVLKKKINDDKIFIMEYNNHSTSEIYLLGVDDTFLKTLENMIEGEFEKYQYLFEKRDNIIVLPLTINNNRYDVFIGDTGGDILGKGRAYKLKKQPEKLEREETLIINPNSLICIKDYTDKTLIIKDTKRASKLFGLDEYFENKAREILGYTVENSQTVKLQKKQIDRILKNSSCYTLNYIMENKDNYLRVMKEIGIKYINENEAGLRGSETPRIILSNNEVTQYIEGLNKVIEVNPISGVEKEVIK